MDGSIHAIGEFAKVLQHKVGERMGSAYSVRVHVVSKNNGVELTGLTICAKGRNIAPTIYLESAYDRYKDGMDMDSICEELLRAYERNVPDHSMDLSFVADFSWAKRNVCCKLINREKNMEMLANTPYIKFLDLAVVAYLRLSDINIGEGTILVRDEQLKHWGVTADVLFAYAMQNTQVLLGEQVTAMAEVLLGLNGEATGEEDREYLNEMQKKIPLYVASNNAKCMGAAVILDNRFLQSFADRIHGDFYILPSSIHETLFLSASFGDAATLKEMVRSINMTEVEACDVLSDNVYLYSRKNQRVEIAQL